MGISMLARACGLVILAASVACAGDDNQWAKYVSKLEENTKIEKKEKKPETKDARSKLIRYHQLVRSRRGSSVVFGQLGKVGLFNQDITREMKETKEELMQAKTTRRASVRQQKAVRP